MIGRKMLGVNSKVDSRHSTEAKGRYYFTIQCNRNHSTVSRFCEAGLQKLFFLLLTLDCLTWYSDSAKPRLEGELNMGIRDSVSKPETKKRITFVLPSINRSGGSRVTVEMGNHLLDRGYGVRIAAGNPRGSVAQKVRKPLKTLYLRAKGRDFHHWGESFNGEINRYSDLSSLDYESGEIVIAVGTYAIEDVARLRAEVVKVRFCHGFAADKPDLTRRVWDGKMATLAVSETLVPVLEKYGAPVIGVVPNGVNSDQYYDEKRSRAGIGFMHATHYNKAPEYAERLVTEFRRNWPNERIRAFGERVRPKWLEKEEYSQFPSIETARRLYSEAKIWVVNSRMEGLPGPVLEAMACGAVVVSSDNIGSREIIESGRNGILVPIGETDAFLEGIGNLLNDENLWRSLSENGKRTASEFTWKRAVESMEEMLVKIDREAVSLQKEVIA